MTTQERQVVSLTVSFLAGIKALRLGSISALRHVAPTTAVVATPVNKKPGAVGSGAFCDPIQIRRVQKLGGIPNEHPEYRLQCFLLHEFPYELDFSEEEDGGTVSPGLVRLAVGVEEADVLIADLRQALG